MATKPDPKTFIEVFTDQIREQKLFLSTELSDTDRELIVKNAPNLNSKLTPLLKKFLTGFNPQIRAEIREELLTLIKDQQTPEMPAAKATSAETVKIAGPKNQKALLKAMRTKLASLFEVNSDGNVLGHIQKKINGHFAPQTPVMLTVFLHHEDLSGKKSLIDATTALILANYLGELPASNTKYPEDIIAAAKLFTSLYSVQKIDFKTMVLNTFEETLSEIYEKEELAEKLTDFEKDYEPVLEVFKQELFPAS